MNLFTLYFKNISLENSVNFKKHLFVEKQLWNMIKISNYFYKICLVSFIQVYNHNISNNTIPFGKGNWHNIIIILIAS